ncbi:MAG: hypothetical protein IJB21_00135 [Bacilli bacterium]|nr:hypothetical protein [Bacilli bacterium]
MTTKKYVLIFITFALLLVLSSALLFTGIILKETNIYLFYILLITSIISFISAIIFIVMNYKKLLSYDQKRISNKIENLDFSVVNININEERLISRLHRNGYRYDEKIYYKKVAGDRFDEYSYDQYYYTFILNVKDNFNYNEYLCVLDKGFNIHNIGFIFIVDNNERILEQVKEYIKNTIIDTQTSYKYEKFFVPIIILNDSVYYFEYKTGIFLTKYGQALDEGLKILEIK